MKVNAQEVTFNVLKAMRYPAEECESVSILKCLDLLVQKPPDKTQPLVRKDLTPVDCKVKNFYFINLGLIYFLIS
jgi:hypothetical protein